MKPYKRGNTYWIKFMVDGVLHRRSTGTGNLAKAREWAERIETARKMPSFDEAVEVLRIMYGKGDAHALPLSCAWDSYTSLAKAIGRLEVAERTLIERRNQFRNFAEWLEKETPIRSVNKVSGAVAAKYAEHLRERGLSPKTRGNIIGNLGVIWGVLSKSAHGLENVWTNLAPQLATGKRIESFSPEQEDTVLAAAKKVGKEWYEISQVSRWTGLRYGDCATLTWSMVDLEKMVIHRTPSKTARWGISVIPPISNELAEVLKAHPRTSEFVFPLHAHYYGKRGKSVQRILSFSEVLKAAGLDGKGFTFHSWRHSFATKLAKVGTDAETRKMMMGHTTDAQAERYDHSEHLAEMRAAVRAVEGN